MKKNIKIDFNTERCKGCELCTTVCPNNLLTMSKHLNKKGYAVACITNEEECIGCYSCALICPDLVITLSEMEA